MSEHKTFSPIETERLLLRPWRDEDRAPFAAMCADPAVMEFLPKLLTREESDAQIDRFIAHRHQHGFCFWVIEDRETGAFAGYTGLRWTDFDAAFTPAVEFGWRLPVANWGRGLATEAAEACLDYAFHTLNLQEVVAVAAAVNTRSRAVMRRIGMTHDPAETFIHPVMPPDHPLQPCVLYRIASPGRAKISTNAKEETVS